MLFFLLFLLFLSSESLQISLMRHANTINNKNNIYTGQLDIPIIPTTNKILNKNYDCIISSPMLRCKQTLEILNINEDTVIYDNRLIECGYGDLTGKKKNKDFFERNFFNKPKDSPIFISESIFEGGLRCYNAYKYHVKHSFLDNDSILILSHKNTLKGFWVFLKLEQIFDNKRNDKLNNFNELRKHINYILKNEEIPDFENLKIEEIFLR